MLLDENTLHAQHIIVSRWYLTCMHTLTNLSVMLTLLVRKDLGTRVSYILHLSLDYVALWL